MDEPCSALDPISTYAIEELIDELKQEYTIVIVTHNMQQASRVSEKTAFFNIAGTGKPGKLIEYDDTDVDLHDADACRRPRTTSPAASGKPPLAVRRSGISATRRASASDLPRVGHDSRAPVPASGDGCLGERRAAGGDGLGTSPATPEHGSGDLPRDAG